MSGTLLAQLSGNGVFKINTATDNGSGAKLQVAGGISSSSTVVAAGLKSTSNIYATGGAGYSANTGVVFDTITFGKDATAGAGWIQAYGSTGGATQTIQLNPLGGNILVGTTYDNSSGAKLQVAGGAFFSANIGAVGSIAGVIIDYAAPTGRIMVADGAGGWNRSLAVIPYGGNLLVGTTTDSGSGAKLQVAGDITTTGVIGTYGYAAQSTGSRPPGNYQWSMEYINDTAMNIWLKGSDGVLRYVRLTLAAP